MPELGPLGAVGRSGETGGGGQGFRTGDKGPSFREYLWEALDEVNRLQGEADAQAQALALGEVRDVSQVMLAAEKAQLALELLVQVRNKCLEAYQEIMRMPL